MTDFVLTHGADLEPGERGERYWRLATTVVNAKTLFHPLRWAILTDVWGDNARWQSFDDAVTKEALPNLGLAGHFRAMQASIPCPVHAFVQVAGDYARAKVLEALRAAGVRGLCARLKTDVHTVKLWLTMRLAGKYLREVPSKGLAREMEHVGQHLGLYWQAVLERQSGPALAQRAWPLKASMFIEPIEWEGEKHRIECFIEDDDVRVDGERRERVVKGLGVFEFTASQVALVGPWYEQGGESGGIELTALAAGAFFTGNVHGTNMGCLRTSTASWRDHARILDPYDKLLLDLDFVIFIARMKKHGLPFIEPSLGFWLSEGDILRALRLFELYPLLEAGYGWTPTRDREYSVLSVAEQVRQAYTLLYPILSTPLNRTGYRIDLFNSTTSDQFDSRFVTWRNINLPPEQEQPEDEEA